MDDPLTFADEHLTRLGLTLDFGPTDLEANRAGRLTPPQVARLEADLRWFYWPMIGAAALGAFVVGATSAAAGSLALLPVIFLMGVAFIPAVLLYEERQHLPRQTVHRTTLRLGGWSLAARRWGFFDDDDALGRVQFPVEGGKKVFATRHLYKVLRPKQTYIVYYAQVRTWSGYRMLSAEPAADSEPVRKTKRKAKR